MPYTYSGCSKEAKVGAILNWLRYNAFKIHSNFTWTAAGDKNCSDKVLDEFEKYFRPTHNKYHSWYTLGKSIQVNLKANQNLWLAL